MKKIILFDLFAFAILAVNCASEGSALTSPSGDTTETIKGVIFTTGFEEVDWRKSWSDYDGNPDNTNTLVANPGPGNTDGNHVMRLRVPAGRGGADLVKVLPSSHKRIYAQWFQYWEPGYDFTARNHGGGLFAGRRDFLGQSDNRPTGADFASFTLEPDIKNEGRPFLYSYYRGMYMDCRNPRGACWGDHFPCMVGPSYCSNPAHVPAPGKLPPSFAAGKWYKIQMMLDMGTATASQSGANGRVSFWVDGVEYGPWQNLWLRTSPDLKVTILSLALFFHGDHSTEGVFLDDVTVSTEPI